MTDFQRQLVRLRRRAVRWYELLLYALLLSLAFGVALATPPATEEARCAVP